MAGGIGLLLYFLVAVLSHLRVGDVKGIGPATFLLALSAGAGHPAFLAPATYSVPPEHEQPVPEQGQASGVSGYRVVVEVASDDRFEPLAGLGQGIVHPLAELRFDASELTIRSKRVITPQTL